MRVRPLLFLFICIVFLANPALAILGLGSRKSKEVTPVKELKEPDHVVELREAKLKTLVDEPYKIAANYVPALLIRTLTNSKVIVNTKKAHVERFVYEKPEPKEGEEVKLSADKEGTLIEKIIFDLQVSRQGFFGRTVSAEGKLNDMDLKYENVMKFSFTKKGSQTVRSTLDGKDFINLDIATDGNQMTNEVKGRILNRRVDYKTRWRSTSGYMGTHFYEIFLKGNHEEKLYSGISEGKISGFSISGKAQEVEKDYYEIEEHYGPLLIKTTVRIAE